LRIIINAQIIPNGGAGGVESVLIGLIAALGQLDDGQEDYVIVGPWQEPDWLKPYIGPNMHIISGPQPSHPKPVEVLKRLLGPLRPLTRRVWRLLFSLSIPHQQWPEVPISDGFYENLGCDVIHFPFQYFVLCALPTIYNPHDLQHLHFPQFFKPSLIVWRETIYPLGCKLAHTVAVGSNWVKQDLIRHYRLDPEKIQVIPWAPPTQAFPEPSPSLSTSVRTKYRLQAPFAFYPAMTWEHKNHLRLLESIVRLRDQEGILVRLVCTGKLIQDHWPTIKEHLDKYKLENQVQFLGMVPPEDLRAIYRLAEFVIIPTLFEAASGPLFEAWREGVPVACSTVTSLPEQAGEAALFFDPFSVEAIAEAFRRMATEEQLRNDLMTKGRERLQDFSWERTAKAYRAVYRRASRRILTDEDRWLLNWDWMRNPKPSQKGAL
jgi:glycosyltransferase involved in cell wall biosynthesis